MGEASCSPFSNPDHIDSGFTTVIRQDDWNKMFVPKYETPCKHCRDGLHRICEAPIPIPTILAYLRGRKKQVSETLTCCDRKEFWIQTLYQ